MLGNLCYHIFVYLFPILCIDLIKISISIEHRPVDLCPLDFVSL